MKLPLSPLRRAAIVVAAVLALAPAQAGAADFPQKPIRVLMPYAAGTQSDAIGRFVSKRLSDKLGQQVIVENKPGANGMLATETAAKATPDGYTLLLGANAVMAVNPFVYSRVPYDPVKDFVPVAGLYSTSYVLVANPSVPFNSLSEFIAAARTAPGKYQYASYGVASASHIAGELFAQMAKVELSHIPYKIAPTTDLIGGQIAFGIESISTAAPHIKAGKLKPLGVTGARRVPVLPDVPTIAEVLPGYESLTWVGLFAPSGTPDHVVRLLSEEVVRIVGGQEFRDEINRRGAQTLPRDGQEMGALLRAELAKSKSIVQRANIRVE